MGVAYSGAPSSLFVDVTIDGDASSSCTTSDDVTTTSDDVISNPGSDVTESAQRAANEQAQPAGGNSVWSVDSGHCSGASDDTVASSDTETLDAGSEEENNGDDGDVDNDNANDDGDDDDDDGGEEKSETLGRRRSATITSADNISILDLLADDSGRVTDL